MQLTTGRTSKFAAGLGLALWVTLICCCGCKIAARGGDYPEAARQSGEAERGAEIFAAGCRCHNGSGKAPDLAHIGADPAHTAGWIAEYASNPKSKNPNSRMPALQGKIASQDLLAVCRYLASQK